MRKIHRLEIAAVIWATIIFFLLFNIVVNASEDSQKMIAFTFDDGPNPVYTERLLDGLAARNAKATFFVVGERLDFNAKKSNTKKCRELVARMAKEGHTVGNHSYSHCWLSKTDPAKVRFELEKTSQLIQEITGMEVKYMRPPGGSSLTAPWVREIAAPMITVCWGNYDTKDWKNRDVDSMVKMITENTHDGDIILLHDNYETSIEAALRAIDVLSAEGYRFVTVDELLSRNLGDKWELDPMRIYCTMEDGDVSKLKEKNDGQ